MKKKVLALVFIMALTLTGCSFSSVLNKVEDQKEKVIEKIEDMVDKVEEDDPEEKLAQEVTEDKDAVTKPQANEEPKEEEQEEKAEEAEESAQTQTEKRSTTSTQPTKQNTTKAETKKQESTSTTQSSNKNTETKEETKTEQKKEETKEPEPETSEPEPGALDASWKAEAKSNASSYSSYFKEILDLVNELRAEEGVAPLTPNNTLCEAACYRAVEIYHSGKFSHTRPDGTPANTVLDGYGISWYAVGENLASGNAGPTEAVEIWRNSPTHNANMLDKDFTKLGVGCVKSGSTFYWVQLFTN